MSQSNAFPKKAAASYDKEKLARKLRKTLSQYPHSALITDITSDEIILSSNAHESVYPASTVKVIIAYAALKLAHAGTLDMDKRITVKEGDIVFGSDAPGGPVKAGETLSLREYLMRQVVYSGNTASNIVFSQLSSKGSAGIGKQDIKILRDIIENDFGLSNTKIERGYLTRDEKSPLVTTPADMNRFLKQVYYKAKAGDSVSTDLLMYMKKGTEERFGAKIDEQLQVMGKYGSKDLFGGKTDLESEIGIVTDAQNNVFVIAIYGNDIQEGNPAIDYYAGVINCFNTKKLAVNS